MKSKPKTNLEVKVSDNMKVKDKLTTTKWWFNGAKCFITVKILPPKR